VREGYVLFAQEVVSFRNLDRFGLLSENALYLLTEADGSFEISLLSVEVKKECVNGKQPNHYK